ncbi:MAG: T9SS type A sorting domain-containing protein, partial [Candidatus Aegiribacteria sp.]|nr:T9SS type A sorting domain-containing protein [Candidatus Aegiribacteria sp.]MBD3294153.1 T9SS type A sorting domain-containing protein [Candidatus Fermentibacteria bacterium]
TPTLWLRCGPNPFRGSLSVTYPDGLEGDTRVEVYDTGGRLLRTLSGVSSTSVIWDGRSHSGEPVPEGVYVIRLVAEGTTASRRVTLLR